MARFDHDDRLGDIEAQLERQDPEFARALAGGRPRRPREYRRGRAWAVLAFALVCLGTGIAIGHGLLIATGLVVAGMAGHLFDPPERRPHRPRPSQ
ncbi:DUF3040 domain-containing protein [Streptomyces sp. NPDC046853]|uniref:DUF3040 domain-containing protein n=1 Tax=unclassified Streptomyces TaxID=2593676 RepID=UPI0034084706